MKPGNLGNRPRKFDLSDFPVVKAPGATLTAAPPAMAVESHGPIAQSVEQWIENSRVGGSNPSRATIQ